MKSLFFELLTASLFVTPLLAAGPVFQPNDADSSVLAKNFRCPEAFSSDEAKQASLHEFTKAYTENFPNNSVRDLMLFRYQLLVDHSCTETLQFTLRNVGPLTEMVRFGDQNFGPKTEEFDPDTKVWTAYFRKDGKLAALSEEDLIFNFYRWKPTPSPAIIANAFVAPRENTGILGKFQAPDDVTKAEAYFIVSETVYAGDTYGYINISKITSYANGVYTVTLAKKFSGKSTSEIDRKARAWFVSDEGKATRSQVGQVGLTSGWDAHFTEAKK